MAQISQGDESMNIEDFLPDGGEVQRDASGRAPDAEVRGQDGEFAAAGITSGLPASGFAAPGLLGQITDQATDAATSNPALTAVLVVIGLAFVAGTIWGLVKGAIKLAVILAAIAAVIWFIILGR